MFAYNWCNGNSYIHAWFHSQIRVGFSGWSRDGRHCVETYPMRKKLATVTAHGELTVTKMVTASHDWAMIELWPSRDWAVIILKMPWLSCDLAVTERWPLLAVTEPWSLAPGAVITVVTVSSPRAHHELTVTTYFLMGYHCQKFETGLRFFCMGFRFFIEIVKYWAYLIMHLANMKMKVNIDHMEYHPRCHIMMLQLSY